MAAGGAARKGRLLRHPMPPVFSPEARVLVLGSMPGAASLAAEEYYAHPRNLFWDIMDRLAGAGRDRPYEERLERLRRRGIALWDVIASCEREGSLDAAIRAGSVTFNRIGPLCRRCPRLYAVCFNGRAAERYFLQYERSAPGAVPEGLVRIALPSTSPANASVPAAAKLKAWKGLEACLDPVRGRGPCG